MSRSVKVLVGASLDASWDRVFRTVTDQSKRARTVITAEMKGAGDGLQKGIKDGLSKTERDYRDWVNEMEGKGKGAFTPAVQAAKQFAAESKLAFGAITRDFDMMAREQERILRKAERDRAHKSLGIGRYETGAFGLTKESRASMGRIGGGVMGAVGFGAHVVRGLLRGAGVNTDLESYIGQNMDIQSKAVQLSNSAYIPSDHGAAGTRVDAKDLEAQARQVAVETGTSSSEALDGLIKFTERTGDLDTGRKILKDMAVLSKSTGGSLSETVLAAAGVATQLGDVKDKGKAVNEVMRAFAGQGQKGAIEIRNMATQMPKLAAAARSVHVSGHMSEVLRKAGVETEIGQGVAMMGALSQFAMARGARVTATTATNSAAAFVRDLSNKTSTKRFAAAGIDIYEDKGHTVQRSSDKIIADILTKTRGDETKMAALMSNTNSRAVVKGIGTYYNDARKEAASSHKGHWSSAEEKEKELNAAGLKAVSEAMEGMLAATQSAQQIQESFALAMQTTESQVQVFNNKMSDASAAMMDQLRPAILAMLPGMVDLAGVAVKAASSLGRFLGLSDKSDADASQSAESGAMNAAGALHGTMLSTMTKDGHWSMSTEQLESAQKKAEALQAEVDKQSKVVAGEHDEDANTDDWTKGMKYLGNKIVGSPTAGEQTKADEDKLERQKSELETLRESIRAVFSAESLGIATIMEKNAAAVQKVQIVGGLPPATPGEGHTPATGH